MTGTAPTPLRVLIADDNAVIRMGLVSLLESSGCLQVVAQAADGRTAAELARSHRPDVALLDVRMPGGDGLGAIGPISAVCPVLMLTYSDDPAVVAEAVRAGAVGYIVHGSLSADDLVRAITGTIAGESHLSPEAAAALMAQVRSPLPPGGGVGLREAPSPVAATWGISEREAEVMELISRGRSNLQVARELFLSEKTVKNHVNRIYAKLGVTSRGEAIARWLGTDRAGEG